MVEIVVSSSCDREINEYHDESNNSDISSYSSSNSSNDSSESVDEQSFSAIPGIPLKFFQEEMRKRMVAESSVGVASSPPFIPSSIPSPP